MARRGERDLGKERFWRRVIRQWRRSGLTIRDYCDHNHCSEPSFYAWRRTLGQRDLEAARAKSPRSRPPRRHAATKVRESRPPTFLPVQVVPTVANASAIEIVFGNGRVVRVAAGFDPNVLRQLLAILEEPRC